MLLVLVLHDVVWKQLAILDEAGIAGRSSNEAFDFEDLALLHVFFHFSALTDRYFTIGLKAHDRWRDF